jgi:hypothetical protein
MPDVGLDTMRRVESVCVLPVGTGMLRLHVHGVAVVLIINHRCEADGVKVTCWSISTTRD